ncbi:MAG: hypothetical protein A2V64_00330 [Bacteroidetes bacterium RBG_13_43_22]|nr:MAG: hypothetical protein A2V64_00330 [Bacteroidetes bacterium RBG_13_43_22]
MRIGIVTDIHENANLLREALRLADNHKCDELACLGDIVGCDTRFYDHSASRSAKECIGLIRSSCRWIVAGNHDLFASARLPSWSNGFVYPENWFVISGPERKKVSSGKVWCYESEASNDLSVNESGFLTEIPEFLIPSGINDTFLFSHYIFPDFTGSTTLYIERNHQLKKHWDFMKSHNLKFSFIGHAHSSFAGFAYNRNRSFLRAFHSLPNNSFYLGDEPVVILLPPLSGEKGRTGFSIIDTENMKLSLIPIFTS